MSCPPALLGAEAVAVAVVVIYYCYLVSITYRVAAGASAAVEAAAALEAPSAGLAEAGAAFPPVADSVAPFCLAAAPSDDACLFSAAAFSAEADGAPPLPLPFFPSSMLPALADGWAAAGAPPATTSSYCDASAAGYLAAPAFLDAASVPFLAAAPVTYSRRIN